MSIKFGASFADRLLSKREYDAWCGVHICDDWAFHIFCWMTICCALPVLFLLCSPACSVLFSFMFYSVLSLCVLLYVLCCFVLLHDLFYNILFYHTSVIALFCYIFPWTASLYVTLLLDSIWSRDILLNSEISPFFTSMTHCLITFTWSYDR